MSWEITWKKDRIIEVGRRRTWMKTSSWFNDEGVQLAVREWVSGASEKDLTAYSLAKTIGTYLDPKRAVPIVCDTFDPGGNRIRARTARR